MKIAREGYPLIFTAAVLTLLAFLAGWIWLGTILGLLALALAGFFRDPERQAPAGEGLVVAPADGKVVSVARVQGDSLFSGSMTRVSIFLSPFDVHINRTPVEGKIEKITYQRGKFLAAYKEEASQRNEHNALSIVDSRGRNLGVVQIAGVLARRIICRAKPGDILARGERFGLIMFGSRTDAYLPEGCQVEVAEGERVKGGETILARFV
ncbi:MAG TPA: phosphatidylserine decarboxylase family protein [Candidatus Binatia bacterium]|nr:phosphatidylserine decarboxylase family protein [Candidatus Binatia bacterium]